MAEVWGAIERFIGGVMDAIYGVIPSYGLTIILLTILVRVVLIPLTIKQIRSMSAMQRLQPELKKLQAKYKGDRQKMNEELMKLYREHGVNPLGGCFPLVMQLPVFIALYSVLRAVIGFDVALPQATAASFTYGKNTVCRTVGDAEPSGSGKTMVVCIDGSNRQEFEVSSATIAQQKVSPPERIDALPPYVGRCIPALESDKTPQEIAGFKCESPSGSGHLPKDGKLFRDIVRDRATFLGMHLACSPTQSTSKIAISQCTSGKTQAAGAAVVLYFSLVALMMGTTYYQQKQMAAQATGPQAKQMQMMGRIMPLFLGFISLNIPAGVLLYWVVSNLWTIGQQYVFLRHQQATAPPAIEPPGKGKGASPAKPPTKPKPKR